MNLEFDFIVFDCETRNQGRRGHTLEVAFTWTGSEGFRKWRGSEAAELVQELRSHERIIGFNIVAFDFVRVLDRYVWNASSLLYPFAIDLYQLVSKNMKKGKGTSRRPGLVKRRRLGLDNWTHATLQHGKSGFRKKEDTCQEDVELTRDLYLYAMKYGYLQYFPSSGNFSRRVFLTLHTEREAQNEFSRRIGLGENHLQVAREIRGPGSEEWAREQLHIQRVKTTVPYSLHNIGDRYLAVLGHQDDAIWQPLLYVAMAERWSKGQLKTAFRRAAEDGGYRREIVAAWKSRAKPNLLF